MVSQLTEPMATNRITMLANCLLLIIGGPSRITAFARSIGDHRTRLDRWETELNSAVPGDPRDTSTPRALGTGFRALLTGDATVTASIETIADDGTVSADTAVTGGVLTLTQAGSAEGDVDTVSPTDANTLRDGDVLKFVVGGTNTATEFADLTFEVSGLD